MQDSLGGNSRTLMIGKSFTSDVYLGFFIIAYPLAKRLNHFYGAFPFHKNPPNPSTSPQPLTFGSRWVRFIHFMMLWIWLSLIVYYFAKKLYDKEMECFWFNLSSIKVVILTSFRGLAYMCKFKLLDSWFCILFKDHILASQQTCHYPTINII